MEKGTFDPILKSFKNFKKDVSDIFLIKRAFIFTFYMPCIQIMYYSTFMLHQIFLIPELCVNLWRCLKKQGIAILKCFKE